MIVLAQFLKKHSKSRKPFLLALSGGPDSLTLFHLLLDLRQKEPLDFAIAHVDHGWRPESAEEAKILGELAATHQIPFHIKRLDPKLLQGNLEAACRQERLHFFKELCHTHGYEAVLMGHHADDAAETILKRIFEGSSLRALSGLQEVTLYEGMQIWRPLLKVSKKEILAWLSQRALNSFNDATNEDTRFLRARMRREILPSLNAHFGKSVTTSLLHLSQEASALDGYLQHQIKPYKDAILEGKWGLLLDLSHNPLPHPFELKEIVRYFAARAELSLSREALTNAVELVLTGSANKRMDADGKLIYIDRKRLFLPFQLPTQLQPFPLIEGVSMMGPWRVTVQKIKNGEIPVAQGWLSAWLGECSVCLPLDDYTLAAIPPSTAYRNKSRIDHLWNDKKVPAFLRSHLPGIWKDSLLIHEFLTDQAHQQTASPLLQIKLELVK